MAQSGKKAIAFSVHQARGTVQKSRHGTEKQQPEVSTQLAQLTPEIEMMIGPEGVAEWHRVMKHMGVLRPTETTRSIFVQYLVMWRKFVADPEGFTPAAQTQLRLAAVELGWSPGAMNKLRGEG